MPSALLREQPLHVERPLPWALGLKGMNPSIKQRISIVAYFSYALAALSLIATFTMPGGITQSAFYVVFAGLWYQIGTSLIKRKKWAWWASTVLLSLFCIGNFFSVFHTIIYPIFSESVTGVGAGRWVALAMFVASGIGIYWIASHGVRSEFNEKPNN